MPLRQSGHYIRRFSGLGDKKAGTCPAFSFTQPHLQCSNYCLLFGQFGFGLLQVG